MLQQRGRAVIDAIRLPSANAREREHAAGYLLLRRALPLCARTRVREKERAMRMNGARGYVYICRHAAESDCDRARTGPAATLICCVFFSSKV